MHHCQISVASSFVDFVCCYFSFSNVNILIGYRICLVVSKQAQHVMHLSFYSQERFSFFFSWPVCAQILLHLRFEAYSASYVLKPTQ